MSQQSEIGVPNIESLRAEKLKVAQKVEADRNAKDLNVKQKITDIEQMYFDSRYLGEKLAVAEENLQYYQDLAQKGLLPLDEANKPAEAQILVDQIKELLEKGDKFVADAFSNPEIATKIIEEAEEMDAKISAAKERKEWLHKSKTNFWSWTEKIADLINKAKDLDQEINMQLEKLGKARATLMVEVQQIETIDGQVFRNLKEALEKGNKQLFWEALQTALSNAKFTQFKLKGALKALINSDALAAYDHAKDDYDKFEEDKGLKGVRLKRSGKWGAIEFLMESDPALEAEFKRTEDEARENGISAFEYEDAVFKGMHQDDPIDDIKWVVKEMHEKERIAAMANRRGA